MAPRARIAAAACLMASGLLVAGTGASLALAAPDSEQGGDPVGPSVGGTPSDTEGPSAGGTVELLVPGGSTAGTGTGGGESKAISIFGDGRNGRPTGGRSGSATTTATEPSSGQVPTSAPQTEPVDPSEQTSGTTTRVTVDPTFTALALPSAVDVVPLKEGEESTTKATETTTVTSTPTITKAPGLGWPWTWPWGNVNPSDDGGGSGLGASQPSWQPPIPPTMQLPGAAIPTIPTIPPELIAKLLPGLYLDPLVDAVNGLVTGVNRVVTGLATAASQLPFAQLTLPVIVNPSSGTAGGGGVAGRLGSPGVVARPGIPAAPPPPVTPHVSAPAAPPPQSAPPEPPPAFSADTQELAAPSYRMGYMAYLRAAGFGEVAAVAVPGFTGILVLTAAGGLIGYRQARAGRSVRAGNIARFMS